MSLDRTNSAGLWAFAEGYHRAGRLVASQENLPLVACYLFCHATELALKAFLRGKGHTIPQLRDIGHDLEKLLVEAEKRNLDSVWPVPSEFRQVVCVLNIYYSKKDFEYAFAGSQTLGLLRPLGDFADDLVAKTQAFCWDQRHLHDGQPTANC